MSERARRYHPPMLGAIAGVGVGDLLLGLNPHLLTPGGVARLLAGGALAGMLLFAPLSARRPRGERPARAALAGAGLLLALLAIGVERQRELYYLFLMNGARRILVAAALGLAVGAALLLACAVVRPRAAALSRVLAGVFVLLLAPPLFGRRAPERTPLAAPATLAGRTTRSLLVVGVEGVSWDLLSRWASDGSLPVFARLLGEGAGGPLASQRPYDRAALWTTAATGKRPARHGVVAGTGFATPLGPLHLVPRPAGAAPARALPLSSPLPLAGRLRRTRTFWEILASRGHGVAVLGWPASWPARDGAVLWATEELFAGSEAPDAGRPADAAARARLVAAARAPLEHFLSLSLVPEGLPEADRRAVRPRESARHDLAVTAAALATLPPGPTSVSALVLSGLADEARLFTPAAAPDRFWGLAPRDAEPRTRALRAYYRFLDETLGDLVEREGAGRVLCVFAPAGWGPRATPFAIRDVAIGREPLAVPDAVREGFLLLWGEGIRSGVRLTAASVADLAPTLLVLVGEPIARDMDGRVLAEAFDDRFARDASVPVVTTFEPGGPQ